MLPYAEMQYSSPSRKQLIRKKLIDLDPGLYQVIGVRFAHLLFNGESVEWVALNEDGSPGQGHPDGRIRLASNKFIDVEVSKKDVWADKIIDDIEAMALLWEKRTNKPVRLIFVTSHAKDLKGKENELKSQKKEDDILQKAAALLHMGAEKITFVHLNELVECLSETKFAQLVRQWLEIPFNPSPFRTVSDEINIIHRANLEEMAWIPSLADYRAGIVQVPVHDLDQARKFLLEKRVCSVWGRGAAGKTTLALLLGIEAEREERTALYLDLMRESISPSVIIYALAQHTDERSLIIFDNVHLYDHGIKQLRSEIAVRRSEGTLPNFAILYVGRDSSVIRKRMGSCQEIKKQRKHKNTETQPEILLTVDADSLSCVYSRFAVQFNARTGRTLPSTAKVAWCADPGYFGHDLVTFSITLFSNIDNLDAGPGGLDCVYDYLRLNYLDPYSEEERAVFMRLCMLSQFDVEATGKALSGTAAPCFTAAGRAQSGKPIASLLARGIVYERDMGQYGFRYWLVHGSFARLLLRSARGNPLNAFETIKDCIGKDPYIVCPLLLALSRDDQYKGVLASVAEWILADRNILAVGLFHTHPNKWHRMTAALFNGTANKTQTIESVQQMTLEIVSDLRYHDLLESWIRSSHLHLLTCWCRQFEAQIGIVALFNAALAIVCRYLVSDIKALTSRIVGEPFDSLTTFLQYLDQRAAKKDEVSGKVADNVRNILVATDLTSRISRDPFNSLTRFLQYLDNRPAQEVASGKVADNVRNILATTDRTTLRTKVLSTQLYYLVPFLQYFDQRAAKKDEVSGKVADNVRNILVATDLTSRISRDPFNSLTRFLQYLDNRPAQEVASGKVADNVRNILAATDRTTLRTKVLSTQLYYLVPFLQYFDQRAAKKDEVSGKAAGNVRAILAETSLEPRVDSDALDAIACFIDYLDKRPDIEVQSHQLADSIRDELTEEKLLRKTTAATTNALTAFLYSVKLRSQTFPDESASLSLHKRVEAVLQSSAMKEKIVAGLGGNASIAELGVMLSAIKKFESSIWKEILNNTVPSIGIDALAERLKPPCSLKAATMFLDIFEAFDHNRLLQALNRYLLADPENLAIRSFKEGIDPTAHLLFRMRHNDSAEIRPFIKSVSKTVVFNSFYGPGGPGPAALFLRNAWRNVGPSPEFDSLWNDNLIEIGRSGLCRWPVNRNPALLLGRTLELWGMISCFSRQIKRPVPTQLSSIYLPNRAMCSTTLSLKEYEDFGPTAACVLGLVALCLNIPSETARLARTRLELARTEMENPNPFINQLVDQAIAWLSLQREDSGCIG